MARLVVLGGGESGVGAAVLAKKQGLEVFLSDGGKLKEKYKDVLSNHEILFEEGKHSEELILNADEVVKSPGIPEKAPMVKALLEKGIPVISEIEFAARHSKAKYVAITGSNGKTTTTLLTYHILKTAGMNVGLAGNVGKSLAAQVADGDPFEWYVLELSSFQLDGMFNFKADISILLNITEDHLDRYGYDVMNYARSKMRITQNQDANCWFIYNLDDPMTLKVMQEFELNAQLVPISIKQKTEGVSAFANENEIIINPNKNPLTMTIQELALQGKHNLYNSMASGIAARIMEVRKDLIRECLTDFQNIEHRLERVNTVYGMNFINDSKATNVNSTWYALESMDAPTVWIAGGVDKGNDYDQLKDMVKQKVKTLVCLGKDNSKLIEAFGDLVENIIEVETMRDAVYQAYKAGSKGDNILLSPACASFDLFQDYEDRGRQFKEAVRNL
ncbi:MAG: UDP-N-acetylmuramoyl-L-alanine--D-glutamate ligase [Flavobacteriales bacterium]